jgi:hypothetical protein
LHSIPILLAIIALITFAIIFITIGLVHDEVIRKLRTLTISSLGLASERISYADLAKKLSLADVNEVEGVVIDAVLSGRVDAKLDQEAQIVIIQYVLTTIYTYTTHSICACHVMTEAKNIIN